MKNYRKFIAMAAALALLIACDQQQPFSPEVSESNDSQSQALSLEKDGGRRHRNNLTVMTRNVYVGADVDAVLAATDPNQIPVLVAQAFQTLLATDFHERAQALAAEIEHARPHLVGLQEISLIRIQSPGDAVVGGTTPATEVLFDYLEILLDALRARGLCYEVAGTIQNADVEVPMVVNPEPLAFDDVRLTDFDVVLARKDVKIKGVIAANYQTQLVVPSLGVAIPRGYVIVDVKIDDEKYRFVNTHFESAPIPELLPIQLGQAQELVAILANGKRPVILVGDLNTEALSGATYQFLTNEGFADVWLERKNRDNDPGFTCCHDPDLLNTEVHLTQRIDFVMMRAERDARHHRIGRRVTAFVVGDELGDRTPSGLWPSDHAGVVARFRTDRDDRSAGNFAFEE